MSVFVLSMFLYAENGITNIMYSIQVGSFKSLENAGNLSDSLNKKGLDAFFFKEDGMYKVRFGNYSSKQEARNEALKLLERNIIDDFYIVSPDTYLINNPTTQTDSVIVESDEVVIETIENESQNIANNTQKDEVILEDINLDEIMPPTTETHNKDNKTITQTQIAQNETQNDISPVRQKIVNDAKQYLGVPYKWGGSNSSGFDSSGLTRAVYKLNGLNLPRTSREQSMVGYYVPFSEIQPGDLVFFVENKSQSINHVGIYIGDNKFIHAPGKGKSVQIDNLQDEEWRKIYKGARKYLK
ncbi:NlpC/P60 family protein [Helicobacter saguini]|uniref:NlpC/P60 family protein n=1 Tax=Helicobacter saguini TaxID=1548018 RepID=UPI001EE8292A|nr:NlpC/P60 family protein [Helicobacter saguini]